MTDKEKLEKAVKLADAMYYAAQSLTTDASKLHKAMEDYHQFIINDYCKEESTKEDLEDAASSFAREDSKGIKNPANFYYIVAEKARIFKTGAQWQKEKMMKDAVEGKVVAVRTTISDKPHTYPWIELEAQLSKNDKVKVIVIKE